MKTLNNIIYPSLLACALSLTTLGCKQENLVFPTQIEAEDDDSTIDRGPVKQNSFVFITEEDEIVRFDVSTVDKEKVKTLFFSYNPQGQKVDTEVSNFNDLYAISNLSLEDNTEVEVWAIGMDGKESKKFTYKVKPLPLPIKTIAKTVNFRTEGFSGILNVSNTTQTDAKLYYKLDNAAIFSVFELPKASISKEISFPKLAIGKHEVQFYVEDGSGNKSSLTTGSFTIVEPTVIPFTTTVQKANWTPWAGLGYDAGFSAERAIDGVVAADGAYQFVTSGSGNPNKYKISFTNARVTADPNYKTTVAENPTGTHSLIVVKSVTIYSGTVNWGINPSIAHVFGYLEDGTVVNLGTFSNPTPVTLNSPFVIDLSTNVLPLKAIRFDFVNSLTSPSAVSININEINLSGYIF